MSRAARAVLAQALMVLMTEIAAAVPPLPCDTNAGPCWTPPLQTRWQYQLEGKRNRYVASGGINVAACFPPFTGGPCVTPDVFDIDLYVDSNLTGEGVFVVNTAAVDAIHARGRRAICYLSAGDVETFRPDYQAFVDFDAQCGHCLIGNPFSRTFPDEFWANVNNDQGQQDFLLQIVGQRVQACAAAGFDGVELDVVDAYAQGATVTGWDISAAIQLEYNQRLANLVHGYGLTVALKNDLGQLAELLPYFDYAINEQCFQYDECFDNPAPGYAAWVAAGKAVFQVEYRRSPRRFCAAANAANFNAIRKSGGFRLYDHPWKPCR
ncbi:MAG TPA: endo alpha-1,4 polygalactosaminidase [Candidatus Dormibacteraeota bacterium]|nr:endo alpha-1,4 polygalactosaminidase [Candidatus Dormibacteraeota bacterium]